MHRDGVFARLLKGAGCGATPAGQQPAGANQGVQNRRQHHRKPQLRDFEHSYTQMRQAILGEAKDDQVGGGANDRAGSPDDGGIAERNEQLAGTDADAPGPIRHNRKHHRDHRSVVHEGRNRRDRNHHAQVRARCGARVTQHSSNHEVEATGPLDTRGYDEQDRYREHPGVGKAGEGLGRREHAGRQQDRKAGQEHHIGGCKVADHRRDHGPCDSDRKPSLRCHVSGSLGASSQHPRGVRPRVPGKARQDARYRIQCPPVTVKPELGGPASTRGCPPLARCAPAGACLGLALESPLRAR